MIYKRTIRIHSEPSNNWRNYETPTILKQSDFNNGTYRIQRPGNYILSESIKFNVDATKSNRTDKPINGYWFAAITIECDEVYLDGNGFSISQDEHSTTLSYYSNIILGNSAFSGLLFESGQVHYPQDTSFHPVNNIMISHLKIGYSQHFGINGRFCSDIVFSHCIFNDCQVGCIQLQSPTNITIEHCNFNGNTKPIPITTIDTNVKLAKLILLSLKDEDALPYYDALNNYKYPKLYLDQQSTSFYAIHINSIPTARFDFPVSRDITEYAKNLLGGNTGSNVSITNCSFKNFKTKFNEQITVESRNSNTPINLLPFGLSGSFLWNECFRNGEFYPSPLSKAMAFISLKFNITSQVEPIVPSNISPIVYSILNSDATTFFANVKPGMDKALDHSNAKGLFPIRIHDTNNVSIENCSMDDIQSEDKIPIVPNTLIGWDKITPPLDTNFPKRARGNDVWGISFECCSNVRVSNIEFKNIISKRGYVFIIDIPMDNFNVYISNIKILNSEASNTTDNSVIDPGDFWVTRIENNKGPVSCENIQTSNITAGGEFLQIDMVSNTSPVYCNNFDSDTIYANTVFKWRYNVPSPNTNKIFLSNIYSIPSATILPTTAGTGVTILNT